MYNYGYALIKDQNEDIIDFSKIFNGVDDVFIDASHFNKLGSKIVGENIMFILKNYEN